MFAKQYAVLFLSLCTSFSAVHAGIVERYVQKRQEEKNPWLPTKPFESHTLSS